MHTTTRPASTRTLLVFCGLTLVVSFEWAALRGGTSREQAPEQARGETETEPRAYEQAAATPTLRVSTKSVVKPKPALAVVGNASGAPAALQQRAAQPPVAPAALPNDDTVEDMLHGTGGDTTQQRALDRRWASETTDPRWTDDTRKYLRDALRDANISPDALQQADCRATVCRVQLQFASGAEASRLYELRHLDYDIKFFPDARGITVYVARAHQMLGDLLGEPEGKP